MIEVMFYEAFEEERAEIEKFLPKDVRAAFTSKTIQEAEEETPPCGLISIRTQSRVPLEWAKNIDGILTRSQGYDHLEVFRRSIDQKAACGYLGNYCARAVAEQAALMMMALLRKLKKQTEQFNSFNRDGLTGGECGGRRALIVGVGNIGREIVDIARGLRMAARGVDIAPKMKDLEYVSLSDGMAWADVVFCALALTRQTEKMFSYDAFRGVHRGTIFINVARGEISPLKDLERLLEEGRLGGVGIDVYPQEGLLADSLRAGGQTTQAQDILRFVKNEKALCTPHNAFNTAEALRQKASLTATAIVSFLKEKTFPNAVPPA